MKNKQQQTGTSADCELYNVIKVHTIMNHSENAVREWKKIIMQSCSVIFPIKFNYI